MRAPTVRLRATVHGRVQGVGFRAYAVDAGEHLGLSGRVSNRPDGTVECVAEGPAPAVRALVRRLEDGPAGARVERVDVVEEPAGAPLPPMTVDGWF